MSTVRQILIQVSFAISFSVGICSAKTLDSNLSELVDEGYEVIELAYQQKRDLETFTHGAIVSRPWY